MIEALGEALGCRVRLHDDRWIGIAEYGDPKGTPWLWFAGTPGSRLSPPPDESATRAAGIRFIALERPGFGVSSPRVGRTILDWPNDVAEVADALGLGDFVIAGASGAGPYLCACAARLLDRVRRVVLCGVVAEVSEPEVRRGLSLPRRAYFEAARRAPNVLSSVARLRGYDRDPEALLRALTKDAATCDRAVLARIWERQLRMTREALRQGSDAFCWELHLGSKPWGFTLEEISTPVSLWHGELDAAAPIEMGRYLADHLPHCEAHFLPDCGHFLHFDHWPAILASAG